MTELRLDQHSSLPLYKQIADQVRQSVASDRIKPGERLPTVRQLAHSLKVNQNTVVKAYSELEQDQVIVSRRGAGTVIASRIDDPAMRQVCQKRLSDTVGNDILKVLSMGYSPEELEASFHLHVARWREERKSSAEPAGPYETRSDNSKTLSIVGSNDLALNLLASQLKHNNPEINIEITPAGSLGGLIALQEGRAHMAGIHLLDAETGTYNYPYVKHVLPGREMVIVHLAYRIQGLMLAASNPKQIRGFDDLKRQDISFINRQKGSGTRVLLDLELNKLGIPFHEVRGYDRELETHIAVATGIAHGEADVGLGIEAAAKACQLSFLPLFRERYDLVIPMENYRSRLLSPLLEIIASREFIEIVRQVGGYDTSETGTTTFLK
ncbi:substrate-binding domain-containing protein [Chloroflexota bacterium]